MINLENKIVTGFLHHTRALPLALARMQHKRTAKMGKGNKKKPKKEKPKASEAAPSFVPKKSYDPAGKKK